MTEQAIGKALTRVVYFSLAGAAWGLTPGMHRLDFGIDLTFEDVIVGVTWSSPGQRLDVRPSSIRPSLLHAAETNVTGMFPWRDMAGRPLGDVTSVYSEETASEVGRTARWAISCRFEGSVTIWLAAANYLEPPGVLLPFGDELIVIHDPTVAKWLGM